MLGLGLPFPTAWLSTGAAANQDALIVVDRNGDGQITSISELLSEYFGSNDGRRTAASGLDALGRFDSNRDGSIDAADGAAWSSLKLWLDDGDARTEAGELVALSSRLSSIDLGSSQLFGGTQPSWAAGNQILRSATGQSTFQANATLYDVGLRVALAPSVTLRSNFRRLRLWPKTATAAASASAAKRSPRLSPTARSAPNRFWCG